MQSNLAGMLGHEMRTPIQAILTYSELLQDCSDKSRQEYTMAIQRNASRLRVLAGNLSDLAKIGAGTMNLKRDTFDLSLLAHAISDDFRNIMTAQNRHSVEISVMPHNHVFVNADMERISQVILNLLDNAVKHTKSGMISIKIEAGAEYVTCMVTDAGPGIDDSVIQVLFNKFAMSPRNCTGFGLYICKSIIEAHGGKIWAENSSTGATFAFSIPTHAALHENYTKYLNSERMS